MSKGVSRHSTRKHRSDAKPPITANDSAKQQPRNKLTPPAILLLGLVVPFTQSAQATEIHYARAIGHEFLPEPAPRKTPAETPSTKPTKPDLPGLGESTQPQSSSQETTGTSKGMTTWGKVLVGALVVGAIAALGNRGGGGGGDDSGSTAANPGSTPPPSGGSESGSGIGIGGGGITINTGKR